MLTYHHINLFRSSEKKNHTCRAEDCGGRLLVLLVNQAGMSLRILVCCDFR